MWRRGKCSSTYLSVCVYAACGISAILAASRLAIASITFSAAAAAACLHKVVAGQVQCAKRARSDFLTKKLTVYVLPLSRLVTRYMRWMLVRCTKRLAALALSIALAIASTVVSLNVKVGAPFKMCGCHQLTEVFY